jgi:hypothetical protein
LALALSYAAAGLRVLPILPGTTRPPMNEWNSAATTNPDIITSWYTERLYRDHGVGLAMGRQPDGRMIFALDVDEHDPAHSGSETLVEWEQTHGSLPDTVRSITGADGLHILYESPVEVRNGVAGDGIDVRGEGGQIVVAPTMHPTTGKQYAWEAGFAPWEQTIPMAPGWLLDLVIPAPVPPSAPPSTAPSAAQRINDPANYGAADWLRDEWDWNKALNIAGWQVHHVDRNGDVHWTRPGKERREGSSAVLHPGGPLVVFSTDVSMSEIRAVGHQDRDGSVSLSPLHFYAAHHHGGDLSSAGRAIRAMMDPADSRLAVVTPGQADAVLAGYLGQFLDWPKFWTHDHTGQDWVAEPLLPQGRQTVLFAPAKHGKSELAFAVVAAVATGRPILGIANPHGPRHVVYLDYEMTEDDLFDRLTLLGYDDTADYSCLHYALLPSLPPLDTQQGCDAIRSIAAHWSAEAVVIDTMGRAVEGDENLNDTYRNYARLTGLMLKADGRAVLRTDHAGKEKDKGQRGASAKNDDADVVLRVDKTDAGWSLKRTHTRVNWVPETIIVDRVEQSDGTLRITWDHNQAASYLPGTGVLATDMAALGVTPTMSRRAAEKMVRAAGHGASTRAIGDALRWMKAGQYAGPTPFNPQRPF